MILTLWGPGIIGFEDSGMVECQSPQDFVLKYTPILAKLGSKRQRHFMTSMMYSCDVTTINMRPCSTLINIAV